jgi:hypothetical protein
MKTATHMDDSQQTHEERTTPHGTMGLSLLWAQAGQRMPFQKAAPTPTIIPSTVPIDLDEAKALFEAFDEDLSGNLDRDETREVLQAVGIHKRNIDPALDLMFESCEELEWEDFRLWVRRRNFIERDVGVLERLYLSLEDPTASGFGKIWAAITILCIIVSVILYMLESHPSVRMSPCHGCEPVLKDAAFFATYV